MSVTLHIFQPDPSSDICIICRDLMTEEGFAHGNKNFDTMCKKCAKAWLSAHSLCPGCNMPVANISSLFSMREKAVAWLKNIGSLFKNNMRDSPIHPLLFSALCITLLFELANKRSNARSIDARAVIDPLAVLHARRAARNDRQGVAFLATMIMTYFILERTQ